MNTATAAIEAMQHRDLLIREVVEVVGVDAATLRIWETRYGWPNPRRDRFAARRYPRWLVAQLAEVVAETKRGTPIGTILATGRPCLPQHATPAPKRAFVTVDLDGLPEPTGREGQLLRRSVLDGLSRGAAGAALVAMATAALPRIHPADRAAIQALAERIRTTEGLP